MQSCDAEADGVGKVIGVGEVTETECILDLLHVFGVGLVEDDVVDNVGQLLGSSHAILRTVDPRGFVVLPIVIDGLSDTGRGNGSPINIGVQLAQEGDEGASIRTSVCNVGSVGRSQVQVLKTGELDVLGKVDGIGQRLISSEESQVFRAEVGGRQTLAIVSVLEDDANTTSRLGELVYYALLEKLETSDTARLTGS